MSIKYEEKYQKERKVLKALLCALLRLETSQITSITITNIYVPGSNIDSKNIFLDINLIVNSTKTVNLELQVINEGNWKERSLYYLTQNFTSLNSGDDYSDIMPTHHIGILDFTLPDLADGFYFNFCLTDLKHRKIYSDKLALSVLNLNQIHLADSEDIISGLQRWAKLFKAKTWEELKMLAEQDIIFEDAANSINELLQERLVQLDCQRRAALTAYRKKQDDTIIEQADTIAKQAARIAELEAQLSISL